MDIILIPGLWLDAASWGPVTTALRDAGHRVQAVTLPGVGEPAAVSGDLGMADWVDAITALIDAADAPVVLVGHSGGGNVAWGVMLVTSRDYVIGLSGNPFAYWWTFVPVSLALVFFGIGWNLVGDGLNALLNPYER